MAEISCGGFGVALEGAGTIASLPKAPCRALHGDLKNGWSKRAGSRCLRAATAGIPSCLSRLASGEGEEREGAEDVLVPNVTHSEATLFTMLQKFQRIDGIFLVLRFDRDCHSVPESHVHMVDGPAAQQLGAIDVCAVDEKPVRENELSLHGEGACASAL